MQPILHLSATFLAVLFGPHPAPPIPRGGPDIEALYGQVMTRALEKAQVALVESLDLTQDHSTWDKAWEVESEHYLVKTTVSRGVAKRVADDLERMLTEFQTLLGTEYTPAERFRINIFPDISQYNETGNQAQGDAVALHSSFYGSFLNNDGSVAAVYSRNATQLGMFVTHSAAHQFVAGAFGERAPIWISEGLAAYFSLFWDWAWAFQEFERMKADARSVPLRTLVRTSIQNFGTEGTPRLIQLGVLFHYLLNIRPDTRGDAEKPFVDYMRARLRGDRKIDERFSSRAMEAMQPDFIATKFE